MIRILKLVLDTRDTHLSGVHLRHIKKTDDLFQSEMEGGAGSALNKLMDHGSFQYRKLLQILVRLDMVYIK